MAVPVGKGLKRIEHGAAQVHAHYGGRRLVSAESVVIRRTRDGEAEHVTVQVHRANERDGEQQKG